MLGGIWRLILRFITHLKVASQMSIEWWKELTFATLKFQNFDVTPDNYKM